MKSKTTDINLLNSELNQCTRRSILGIKQGFQNSILYKSYFLCMFLFTYNYDNIILIYKSKYLLCNQKNFKAPVWLFKLCSCPWNFITSKVFNRRGAACKSFNVLNHTLNLDMDCFNTLLPLYLYVSKLGH